MIANCQCQLRYSNQQRPIGVFQCPLRKWLWIPLGKDWSDQCYYNTLAVVLGLGGLALLSMSQWVVDLRTGSAWKLGEGS